MNNERAGISVIGSGYWGKNLVRNFDALGTLHSVCDSNRDTLKQFQRQYPDAQFYVSFSEVLTNPDIQGVALATPAVTHAAMAKEALLAGKDVYVEKPLCLTEQEGVELNRIADEHGRILMIGHLLWYHPMVLKLKDLVDNGELGRIQYIYSNRLNLGKLRREENVLWSFAPHDVSVILGLTGEMPQTVRAQGGNFLHQEIADTTVTLLNFSSGVRAHIFVSWLHPFKEQKLVVVGDKQMAVFNDTAPWEEKLQLYPHMVNWEGNIPVADRAEAVSVDVAQDEPLRAECDHFLQCIKERSRPRTDGQEGLRVLRVLNCCQESLETDKTVPVSSVADHGENFVHDTACIDDDVEIGQGTKIWHFSHVLSGSKIGRNCSLGQNVVLGPDVTIGSGCKIQNNVSLFKGVHLEDDVFCGPSMVFTNVINPRAAVSRKDEFKTTTVGKGATIGANATIVCGIEIGEFAFIGAGSVVTRDVPAYALVTGNPSVQTGWMSAHGEKLALPVEGSGEDLCPYTGVKYVLQDGKLAVS